MENFKKSSYISLAAGATHVWHFCPCRAANWSLIYKEPRLFEAVRGLIMRICKKKKLRMDLNQTGKIILSRKYPTFTKL